MCTVHYLKTYKRQMIWVIIFDENDEQIIELVQSTIESSGDFVVNAAPWFLS